MESMRVLTMWPEQTVENLRAQVKWCEGTDIVALNGHRAGHSRMITSTYCLTAVGRRRLCPDELCLSYTPSIHNITGLG